MTAPKPRVIPTKLVPIVKITMNIKLDSALNGEFIAAVGPKGFHCLAGGKPVDVDEGAPAALEAGAEVSFGGEGAGDETDVGAEGEEVFRASGVGVAGEDSDGVGSVSDEACDHRDALGAGAADDEDGWFGGHDVR